MNKAPKVLSCSHAFVRGHGYMYGSIEMALDYLKLYKSMTKGCSRYDY